MSILMKTLRASNASGKLLAGYRGHTWAALALGLVSYGCAALLMFASGYLICRTAQPDATLFKVLVPVAFVQLFGLGRPLARYFERLVSHDWVFRVTSDLRYVAFHAIARKAKDPVQSRSTGSYLSLLVDDIGHLQNLYLRVAFPTAIAALLAIAASLFCGLFNLQLLLAIALFALASGVVLPLAAYWLTQGSRLKAKHARASEYEDVADDIIGALDITLAGRNEEFSSKHIESGRIARKDSLRARRTLRILEFIAHVVLAATVVALLALSWFAFSGSHDDVNWIAAFALGVFPLAEVILMLPASVSETPVHLESLERIEELLSDDEQGDTRDQGCTPGVVEAARSMPVSISHVTYRYPGSSDYALQGLDLEIPAGANVAVLGKSGAGKSTLAALMRGFASPDAGVVEIGGIDAQKRADEGKPVMTYISQSPYVFDRTLRENLVIANEQVRDEELLTALEKVGLADKLQTMEDGLSTRIGDTGVRLSGGEAHRIALVRALVSDAPVVVLDEPFTALDPITERQLLSTIFDVLAEETVIVITHHLMEIERFDYVAFIEDGRLDMFGTPEELKRTEPRFASLLAFDRLLAK